MESTAERIDDIRNQIIPAYKKNPSVFASSSKKVVKVSWTSILI